MWRNRIAKWQGTAFAGADDAGSNDAGPKRIQWDADLSIRLDMAGWVRFALDYRGLAHSHPFWELIAIGNGRGTLHHLDRVVPCGSERRDSEVQAFGGVQCLFQICGEVA